jgi:hypothetical protein
MRFTMIVLLLSLLVGIAPWQAQAQLAEKIEKLCQQTVAALQGTSAAALAEVFSTQASSFLAAPQNHLVHVSRAQLQKQENWSDQPLFTPEAKVGEVKVSDRWYVTLVEASVEDGGRKYQLDGVAVMEGGQARWLTLAVLPAADDQPAPAAEQQEIAALLQKWQAAVVQGRVDEALGWLAPEGPVIAVVGPDANFYLFADLPSLQTALEELTTVAPPTLTVAEGPYIKAHKPVAAVRATWQFEVPGFLPQPLEVRAHLYYQGDTWLIAGLCGLPPGQP